MQERLQESKTESIMRNIQKSKARKYAATNVFHATCKNGKTTEPTTDTLRTDACFYIGRFTALATSACEF
jgi:hypothetical protein